MPHAGTLQPYRPKPDDFRETFIRIGWSGVEAHYRAHKQTISRWIDEEGRDDLLRARQQVSGYGLKGSGPRRFVLGLRRSPRALGRSSKT